MAKVNAEAINVYGAKIIYEHLSAMQAEVEGVMTSADVEYVHHACGIPPFAQFFGNFWDCFPK